jgi:hypothetical protein
MAAEAKNSDAVLGGVVLLFLLALLYSCFSGGEEEAPLPKITKAPVKAAVASAPTADQQKQAEDFVKATINLNGFLCAKIIDVKPAGGANLFAVNCILNRNGTGSAVYLFDGDSQKVSRL